MTLVSSPVQCSRVCEDTWTQTVAQNQHHESECTTKQLQENLKYTYMYTYSTSIHNHPKTFSQIQI